MATSHQSEITLQIELDENKIPETLKWTAEDGGVEQAETKALLLSIWDPSAKETLSIDLWTKDMPVDEMKLFFIRPWSVWPQPLKRPPKKPKCLHQSENTLPILPTS